MRFEEHRAAFLSRGAIETKTTKDSMEKVLLVASLLGWVYSGDFELLLF